MTVTLIDSFMVPCTKKVRGRTPDGEGGWTTSWVDDEEFEAAIVQASAVVATIAEAQGQVVEYVVTTGAALAFHDAFERDSDEAAFRITKVLDPTPSEATFQFRQYGAERWELA